MKFFVTIERPDYWATTPPVAPDVAARLVRQAQALGLTATAIRAEDEHA